MDSSTHHEKKHEQDQQQFTTMPISEGKVGNNLNTFDGSLGALKAAPGPIVAQDLPPQEGTKEEREARKKELNKD